MPTPSSTVALVTELLPASPAKAHIAADALQPATPPQLTPRRRTADASSDTE
jgi:hypothetical protein